MTVIRFAPGLKPVLKHLPGQHNQQSHGGGGLDLPPYGEDKRDDESHPEYRARRETQRREAMLGRLEALDTPEGRILAEAWRRGMTGKDLPDSVLGADGIETHTEPPGSMHAGRSSQHVTTAGMERIKAAQGWDAAATGVDDATFDRLIATANETGAGLGGFKVVYRGGPEGMAADMASDQPFIGTGMSGPGTYVSDSPARAGWYGSNGGEVVRSLVPDYMVTHSVEDDRYGAKGLAALHGHPSSDNGDGWADGAVVFNTSAMIVAVPSATVAKHLPGQHDQKTHGRGGGGEPEGMKVNADGSFKYGELNFGPAELEKLGQQFGYTDALEWQAYLGAGHFVFWENNWATRTVSANMMGLDEGYAPRGESGLSDGVRDMIRTAKYGETGTYDEETARPLIREGAAMLAATSRNRIPDPIHRGLGLHPDDPRLSVEFGDEITIPVSAFSTDRHLAEDFATGAMGQEDVDRGNRTPVVLSVLSGTRGYDTKNVNQDTGAREVVSQGRFVVLGNKMSTDQFGRPIRLIVLRQDSYYDAFAGKWVDSDA